MSVSVGPGAALHCSVYVILFDRVLKPLTLRLACESFGDKSQQAMGLIFSDCKALRSREVLVNISPSNAMPLDLARNEILLEDLQWFLPGEKAAAAMRVLDVDGDGKVSLSDIRDAVVAIYRERRNLAFTLKDTSSVVNKLELIFAVVIHFFTVGFYLNLFNVASSWPFRS